MGLNYLPESASPNAATAEGLVVKNGTNRLSGLAIPGPRIQNLNDHSRRVRAVHSDLDRVTHSA